jgi:hypothetical protein
MGPRPSGRGNRLGIDQPRTDPLLLQWGRGRPAAEIRSLRNRDLTQGLLQWGRGRPAAEIRRPKRNRAT